MDTIFDVSSKYNQGGTEMKDRIDLLIAKEVEFCEGEMKNYLDRGYSSKITEQNSLVYWRGRKEGAEEIRSKIGRIKE